MFGFLGSKLSLRKMVYVPSLPLQKTLLLDVSSYSVGFGDYISMGKDFGLSIRNEEYAKLHMFFSTLEKGDTIYTKKKKAVVWAADFVLLDLPMDSSFGHESVPLWNKLTEDHVRHGLGVASASLRDSGWIVVISSITGL